MCNVKWLNPWRFDLLSPGLKSRVAPTNHSCHFPYLTILHRIHGYIHSLTCEGLSLELFRIDQGWPQTAKYVEFRDQLLIEMILWQCTVSSYNIDVSHSNLPIQHT